MKSNLQIIADHYEASARGDLAGMLAEVASNVRWTEMDGFPCAGTWIGPEQVVAQVFSVLARDWEGYRFELDALVDGGASIVGIGTYRGVHRTTGKAMAARVAHHWQLEGGRITAFEQFTDTLRVAQAMA
ncbi:nuclear transport factor 2 family protein [Pseudomonas otitidis]|uniref:nuclear transport factor 2 family protein n=1 Tax=Metapseudomonas otitidis TaxID=319939 RepID=UPI0024ACED84|nr:nuclear transport factor 2 family protein [Pseudomonas otitidis]MDI6525691.1 nuclear transport factor 2 family protein [Pseudomonas otitidis]